ncbi:hypothetical protein QAD02_019447 [Eretmocerus hayati]|uniref:Uncharacterized protein n=1 Tax=Eretmocerus hayati TaxID=131215 RepID=A0ACC2PPF1_9HYME|nr:hypothetical protein QAD02_019447 [Eretmocerus hayati]
MQNNYGQDGGGGGGGFGGGGWTIGGGDMSYEQQQQQQQGRNLPQMPGVRPMVDPSAAGEVDPNLYPEAKEATHKIRGKNDFLEYLFGAVDQDLLTVKTFYFFFYAAFGSLFPLMGVYFKQMGMNAGQCGLLIGLRPFIEFFSAPFWGSQADRMQKGKAILLASLSCWIIFTLPLGFIQPSGTSCMMYYASNQSFILEIPAADARIKRSAKFELEPALSDEPDERAIKLAEENYMRQLREEMSGGSTGEGHSSRHRLKRQTSISESLQNAGTGVEDVNMDQIFLMNRPADVAEYKKFLKNEPLEKDKSRDKKPPKKYHEITKTRAKPSPPKIMVKRDTDVINRIDGPVVKVYQTRLVESDDGYLENVLDQKLFEDQINVDENEYKEFETSKDFDMEDVNRPYKRIRRAIRRLPPGPGEKSPVSVAYAENYNPVENRNWVKPKFSSIVYRLPDIQKAFFLQLLLVIVGEFFAAPAITLADSAVITLLGEDADRYGHQRMFGSLGWGLSMFFVGIALDHSTAFPNHLCGPDAREKNYTICFAIFSVLMGAALITATQINFKYDPIPVQEVVEKPQVHIPTREEELQNQLSQQLNLPGLQDSSAPVMEPKPAPPEGKTKMFAYTTREIPEWMTVLKQFKDLKCASFLFVAWFMGFGIGLIFTFLFWHLQEYGGTPTLFGIASVINHISEIFAYFFSFKLIREMGHVKVLCLGLGGNVVRFLYIAWLKDPWWVLPFEFMQGITHAAVWAACCSYIAHNTPTHLRSSAQGVLQGLHHGLGRGCGAIIGGMFVAIYGTKATFYGYGLLCLLVLGGFIFINFYRVDTGFISDLPQTEDPHQVAEVTHLAPHGVPSNAVPRALSSNRLHELAQENSYGATYQTSGGNLSVPGGNGGQANPNNPFLNGQLSQSNYNYGADEKVEDDFIRKSFQRYSEIVSTDFDIVKVPPIVTHLHAQQPCTNPFHQHDYDW